MGRDLTVIAFVLVVGGAYSPRPIEFLSGEIGPSRARRPTRRSVRSWTRHIAGYFGKHVPGHPSVTVQNMPGAGSVIAANYIYNVASRTA